MQGSNFHAEFSQFKLLLKCTYNNLFLYLDLCQILIFANVNKILPADTLVNLQ